MSIDLDHARSFVMGLDLPAPRFGAAATPSTPINFDAARDQALVVGSEVVSFVQGVTAEQRGDIVNSTLLAQLRAKKVVPEPRSLAEIREWYNQYFTVLGNRNESTTMATRSPFRTTEALRSSFSGQQSSTCVTTTRFTSPARTRDARSAVPVSW